MIDPGTADRLLLSLQESKTGLSELYEAMRHELFSYAYSILRNTEAAQDTVSETMLRLYRSIDRYIPTGQGRAYVYAVCRHAAMEQLREQKRQQPAEILPETEEDADAVEYSDLRLFLRQLLQMLELPERQVLVLHYFHDLTFREVAQITGMPEGSVKWRHTRALAKCRALAEKGATVR